jgi:hypothetical protein
LLAIAVKTKKDNPLVSRKAVAKSNFCGIDPFAQACSSAIL